MGGPPPGRNRAQGEEMTFATHPERQFMEYLRGRGWVKGTTLPPSRLTASLHNEIFYRMTDIGLKALRAPVPAGRPSKAKGK
jgi:hypothetical protein